MSVIPILILVSLALALLFLGGFIWAVRAGQYEDTYTPSLRVLLEEATQPAARPTGDRSGGEENFRTAGAIAAPHPAARPNETNGAAATTRAELRTQ